MESCEFVNLVHLNGIVEHLFGSCVYDFVEDYDSSETVHEYIFDIFAWIESLKI